MGILQGDTPFLLPVLQSGAQNASGQQLAQNFLDSYWKERQMGENRRQFDLQQPIRQAQYDSMVANVDVAKARLTGVRAESAMQVEQQNREALVKAKMVAAMDFESRLGGSYDQNNRVTFLEFLKGNQELIGSTWAIDVGKKFDTTAALDGRIELEQEKSRLAAKKAEDIAAIRADNAAELAKVRGETSEFKLDSDFIAARLKDGSTAEEAAFDLEQSKELRKLPKFNSLTEASEWADNPANRGKPVLVMVKVKEKDAKGKETEVLRPRRIIPEPMSVALAAKKMEDDEKAAQEKALEAEKASRKKTSDAKAAARYQRSQDARRSGVPFIRE